MMKTILVPLDGSAHAQQALPHALSLARRDGAQLLLLGVDERFIYRPGDLLPSDLNAAAHLTTYLSQLSERIRRAGWEVRWQAVVGGPAEAIVQRAQEEKASTIVMSSHGRRGLTRWMLGSVTERVAREVPCALLVVRTAEEVTVGGAEFALGSALAGELPAYAKVLVPLDGSATAELALERARSLAGQRLDLLEVIEFPPPIVGGPLPSGWAATVSLESETERMRYLEGHVSRLQEASLEVKATVRRGAAADEILSASEGVDLVVMTSCSRPWFERMLTGSLAARVLRHSACPVLLLPGLPGPAVAQG